MVNALDVTAFHLINKTCSNPFLDGIAPVFTELGDWHFLLAVAAGAVFFKKRETKVFGILLLVGLVLAFWSVRFLKTGVARPRPFFVLPDVRSLIPERGFSFPSGHSTYIFLAVSLACAHFRRYYYLYWLAAGVGFCRVYLGVHFPSDVVAGALLGSVLGYGLARLGRFVQRPGFPLLSDTRVV